MLNAAGRERYMDEQMSIGSIFIVLFITLGPVKLIAPFARLSISASNIERRNTSVRISLVAAILLIAVALAGGPIARNWGVSFEAMLITTGAVLFIWALLALLEYRSSHIPARQTRPLRDMAIFPLTIPSTITPAGIAAVMLFTMRPNADWKLTGWIIGFIIVLMGLNLLFMLTNRVILRLIGGLATVKIIGAVLLVIQIALAVEVLLVAFSKFDAFRHANRHANAFASISIN